MRHNSPHKVSADAVGSYRPPYGATCIVVVVIYTTCYLSHQSLPGNNVDWPLGWWGWWDQSKYLESARAFSRWDLTGIQHWYFPGYSLFAAPFRFMGSHQFFIPNVTFLLTGVVAFLAMARRFGIPRWGALIALAIGLFPSWMVFQQYLVPWNTTLTMAALMIAALVYMKAIDGGLSKSGGAAFAAAASILLFTRPIDVVAIVPMLLHLGFVEMRAVVRGDRRPSDLLGATAVTAAVGIGFLLSGLLLYFRLYGWQPSPYMMAATSSPFDVSKIPFRFYVMFISPVAFFGGGIGIVVYMPWVAIGLVAIPYATLFRSRYLGLYLSIAVFICIYLTFPDWLPHNVWRFFLIHYLVWPLLMISLLGAVMLRDIWRAFSIARLAVAVLPVAFGLLIKLSAIDVAPISQARVEGSVTASFVPQQRLVGLRVSDSSAGGDAVIDRGQFIEVNGVKMTNSIDYRLVPSGGSLYVVFDRPVLARTLLVSFPKGSTIGREPRLMGVKAGLAFRGGGDWRRADDLYFP